MRAAIYARVSTVDQKEDSLSLETQVSECLNYAIEHDYLVLPENILCEQASGAYLDRPLLNKARMLLREGEVQALIVHSPDRLTRKAAHLVIITEELSEYGARLLFVHGLPMM